MAEICATPTKPLRRKAFLLDGLITPTLKAAGSNPVGRTKTGNSRQSFAGLTSSSLFFTVCSSPLRLLPAYATYAYEKTCGRLLTNMSAPTHRD